MSKVMLINVTQAEESRVAIVQDGLLEWIEIETGGREKLKGNIYKAVVENVNSSLQAAFVRFSSGRSGFLPLDEVNFKILPQRKRGGRQEKPEKEKKQKKDKSTERAPSNRGARTRISEHLQVGQELLVQVVREQYASKPPTLSTFISLPGRYLVLLPGSESGGVSRRIEDEAGRDRLKKLIKELKTPEGMGLIVRTAGLDQNKTELARDMRYLTRLWKQVESASKKSRPPSLIYQERDLVLRAIRDLFTPDIREVRLDNAETYKRAESYFKSIMPGKQKLLKLDNSDQPLFTHYDLEDQIENIYKRRVPLKSGGAIVIDATEALTSIDVNSGKTREANIEETALKANLEAADQIARQLRLRDIGGLVVIDFIDMRSRGNIRAVEKQLKDAMKQDTARYDVTRISKLGLMEMSRQRMRASTASASYMTCEDCEGSGVVKTVESSALALLRRIHTRAARGDLARVRILLPADIANFLLNRKRLELARLEERYQTEIQIIGRVDLGAADLQFEVEARAAASGDESKVLEPQVKHPEMEAPGEGEEEDEAEKPAEKPVRRRRRRSRKVVAEGPGEGEPAVVAAAEIDDAGEPAGDAAAAEETPARGTRRRRARGGRGRRGRGRRESSAAAGDSAGDEVQNLDEGLSGPPDVISGPDDDGSAHAPEDGMEQGLRARSSES